MEPIVKKDILNVLTKAKEYIENKEFEKLKELSNHTIHNSAIYQDSDSINTCVLIYSLYKLFNQNYTVEEYEKVIQELKKAIDTLGKDDYSGFNQAYKSMFHIFSLNRNLKSNIQYVVEHAKLKKGSKVIYHGMSVAQAANIFGISQWDLMNYLGKTSIYDTFKATIPVEKRLEYARQVFKKK